MHDDHIISLRIPNLFVEGRNRIYVIKSDPVTMIDTGIATDRAFDELVEQLKPHGLSIGDIKRVVLTHKHIDHVGNAWRIQEQSGAEILIHREELPSVTDVDPGGERFIDLVRDRLAEWQVPNSAMPPQSSTSHARWNIQSANATGLDDGDRIPLADGEMLVIHTPGHTFGSICLSYRGHLFSGDHVLPDISPNVGGGDMRRSGLLQHFLDSLDRIADAAGDGVSVLPGHGEPFTNLRERCDELTSHHRQRLDETMQILESGRPHTAYEVAHSLFGDMQDFHVVLGCAEADAHLEYLQQEGRVLHEGGKYRLSL